MKIELNEITMNDEHMAGRLLEYLSRLKNYPRFDNYMVLKVYVDDDKDFCALEAVSYKIQFTNNAKKLSALISSQYDPIICNFDEVYSMVQHSLYR